MRYVIGLELKEIAEITGDSVNTVSVHVHRGINKLRELFNKNNG
jgi:DNA-directed RNA polymerase specialized sigma24 family protein